ncbi:MAG TPA: CPBP family intramembrane glutamic endopeptidase [Acidobacteriaceae bacterium]|nr:CPBP family intramembrane glutamic endopeptidase [Acidobacteriaceae bacterium]
MLTPAVDYPEPRRKGIAPIWHTCVLILICAGLGAGEIAGSGQAAPSKPLPFYLGAIAFEWLLFAYVWWGIRLRKYPLAALIARGRPAKYGRDAVAGIAIWLLWYAVESLIAFGLAAAGVTNGGAQGTIFPHGAVQIVLWIIMAASSGFSEEIAFRGYFLRQFSAWTGSTTIGVVLQAILFCMGHIYLGVRQVVLIFVSGILLGIFAAWLRNLRPLMVTHAWADVFGGIIVHGLPYK